MGWKNLSLSNVVGILILLFIFLMYGVGWMQVLIGAAIVAALELISIFWVLQNKTLTECRRNKKNGVIGFFMIAALLLGLYFFDVSFTNMGIKWDAQKILASATVFAVMGAVKWLMVILTITFAQATNRM
jgi:hypothetical protein